jgi:histidine decarboxylase
MTIEDRPVEQAHAMLERALGGYRDRRELMLGYQWSQRLDGFAQMAPFLDFHIDNIGDPFSPSLTALNSKEFEREILDYFAGLWHARGPSDLADPESYWGYVLSMGSTEGNLFAMWNARDHLSGGSLLTDGRSFEERREPVLFYSVDAHYSLAKGAAMLCLPTFHDMGASRYPGQCPITDSGEWPTAVPSVGGNAGTGCIDVAALGALVEFFADRGHPPCIILNLGSTFKGAYDVPEAVWAAIEEPLLRNGLRSGSDGALEREGYWLHIDGALGGGFLPFMEMAARQGLIAEPGPVFDFRLPYVSSIVASGHKWFGTPFPTGVYLSKQKLRMAPPSDPRYIGSPDTTFSGARNGLSSLLLWYALSTRGREEQVAAACDALDLADYLVERLRELEDGSGIPLWVDRAEHALAVRFRRPADEIVTEFGLVGERVGLEDGSERDCVHVFCMPHVSKQVIDALITRLSAPAAFRADAQHTEGSMQ